MRKRIQDWIEQYRCMDWAVLFLRLFTGAMLLLHNIGKIQNYNEIITSYPSILGIDNAATFVVVTVLEAVLAVLLILGLWVRLSAFVLVLGLLLLFAWKGLVATEADFVWLGVYVTLVVSGGGIYAFDEIFFPAKSKK